MKAMLGKKIRYNKDMTGEVVKENDTHVLIQFESGTKYCIEKNGLTKC